YSLHRLRHYTGTAPDWFQNFVLFTNYQFYIDEFVRLGHEEMADPQSDYTAFVEPGNVVPRAARPRSRARRRRCSRFADRPSPRARAARIRRCRTGSW